MSAVPLQEKFRVEDTIKFLREAMHKGGVTSPEFEITVPIQRNPVEDPASYAYVDPSDIIVVARGSAPSEG